MIKLNEVTWYSKLAAVIFFIGVLPVLTFYIGIQYQKTNDVFNTETNSASFSESNTISNPQKISQINYEMVTVNNFSIPQIKDFENKDSMEKVNSYFIELAQTSTCGDDIRFSENNYYEMKGKVSYAQNDIFSVQINLSYNCSGPHPINDSNDSVTFDMKTGDVVEFEDLFINYERDKKAILSLIFKKQIKEEANIPENPNDSTSCETEKLYSSIEFVDKKYDRISDYFNYLSYNISASGISAQPSFPHVIAACSQIGTAPIESLSPYFDSSSILSRIN
jgi:hypothetical protein